MSDGFEVREKSYYRHLKKILNEGRTLPTLSQTIVDAPFADPLAATYLELGIVVFLKVDKSGKYINRIALSNTIHAADAVKTSEKQFTEIIIPLSDKDNIIAKAINTGSMQRTEDWKDLFVPALNPESARFNQASAGIACSIVQPIDDSARGAALIFSFFQHPKHIKRTENFTAAYAALVGEALSL